MIFYTDGSCSANGQEVNKGGFGVVALDNNEKILYTYSKQAVNTTNNEQELEAILYVFLKHGVNIFEDNFQAEIPIVYSDSAYSINTLNNWMFSWAKNNWIKSDNKEPKNLDLIKQYYNHYMNGYRIDLRKVKGHSDNRFNQLADDLACWRVQGSINNTTN